MTVPALDMAENMVGMFAPLVVVRPELGGAFDATSRDLFDVDVLDTFVVVVLLDMQRDGRQADSLAGEPRYALLENVLVNVSGESSDCVLLEPILSRTLQRASCSVIRFVSPGNGSNYLLAAYHQELPAEILCSYCLWSCHDSLMVIERQTWVQ